MGSLFSVENQQYLSQQNNTVLSSSWWTCLLCSTSRTFIVFHMGSIAMTTATSHRHWQLDSGQFALDPRRWPATDPGRHTSTLTSVGLILIYFWLVICQIWDSIGSKNLGFKILPFLYLFLFPFIHLKFGGLAQPGMLSSRGQRGLEAKF